MLTWNLWKTHVTRHAVAGSKGNAPTPTTAKPAITVYILLKPHIFIDSCQNHVLVHDLTLDIIYVVVSRTPRYFKQRINIAVGNASAFRCCDQSSIPWLSVVVCYRVWRSPVKTCGFSSSTLTFSQRPTIAKAKEGYWNKL